MAIPPVASVAQSLHKTLRIVKCTGKYWSYIWSGRWESNPRPNLGKPLNVMACPVGHVKVTRAEYTPDKTPSTAVSRLRHASNKNKRLRHTSLF